MEDLVGSARFHSVIKQRLTIQIEAKEGTTSVKFDLNSIRTLEWRISAFFRCIGQKKHGEKLTMDWGKVVGSKGRAYIFKQRFIYQIKMVKRSL